MAQKYAIVDIETTGGHFGSDRITEIAIVVLESGIKIREFQSLVNPNRSIPPEITRITGINNQMVALAPQFFEIARDIILCMQDCIFVAHNVQFDYSFIRNEYSLLGYSFNMKRLCTVRLARKFFPGLRSYSLENLIRHFQIRVNARHRAYDDVCATVEVFMHINRQNFGSENYSQSLKNVLRENKLPASLTYEDIRMLPEMCGIYKMKDLSGSILYIGKSLNIRERIIQHFNDVTTKTSKMIRNVHSIETIVTGSELVAILMETEQIKQFTPPINRALKNKDEKYFVIVSERSDGLKFLEIKQREWVKNGIPVFGMFTTVIRAKSFIRFLEEKYELCSGLAKAKQLFQSSCELYVVQKCHGVCVGKESIESYNLRFNEMIVCEWNIFCEDLVILDTGRHADEKSFVLIENGFCKALGFLTNHNGIPSLAELEKNSLPYRGTYESNRMIKSHLEKNKQSICLKISELPKK